MAEKENRAKAFCYDQGITTEEMDAVWQNAVKSGNAVINQLVRSGCTWHDLNKHLLQEIYNRFKEEQK